MEGGKTFNRWLIIIAGVMCLVSILLVWIVKPPAAKKG